MAESIREKPNKNPLTDGEKANDADGVREVRNSCVWLVHFLAYLLQGNAEQTTADHSQPL